MADLRSLVVILHRGRYFVQLDEPLVLTIKQWEALKPGLQATYALREEIIEG